MQFGLRRLLLLPLIAGILFAVVPPFVKLFASPRGCFSFLRPCEGVVTLNGEPLPFADILLANKNCLCSGHADEFGGFQMVTGTGINNGVAPGVYHVSIRLPAITPAAEQNFFPETDEDYASLKRVATQLIVPEDGLAGFELQLTTTPEGTFDGNIFDPSRSTRRSDSRGFVFD